jgi:hypothetical protein
VYKLKFVILGLDPGIQNILKRMDSRLRGNDGFFQKRYFIHRH